MDGQALTIVVSLLACAGCLFLRPGTALGLLIASAMIWPEYLRIPMGIAQMSVPRLAALVLFFRMVVAPGEFVVRWRTADSMVVLLYVWMLLANLAAGTPSAPFNTLIGSGFDTLLMYQVGRRVFTDPREAPRIIYGLIATGIVLAPIALLENKTKWSPYVGFLLDTFGSGFFYGGGSEIRLGMYRSFGSTQVPIYFGMAMMVIAGLIFALRECFHRRWALWIGLGAAVMCVFSSLSSGPWMGLLLVGVLNAFYWMRRMIGPTLWALGALMVAVEVLSNRHFYHLIDRLAMGDAYYRTRLLEVAFKHLDEFWLFGAGGASLGHWGQEIDQRNLVDMVNNYLIVAVNGGLGAVLLYIGVKVCVLICLVRGFRYGSPLMKPITFGLGALLVALSIGELSVGLFGPVLLFSYIVMGCSVSTCEWADEWGRRIKSHPRRTAASLVATPGQPAQPSEGLMRCAAGYGVP
jgi:hypothetical protein